MDIGTLIQTYWMCAGVGSGFIIFCAFRGSHHGHAGGHGAVHGGGVGHGAIGHAGAGHAGAIGHGGALGHGGAGHLGLGHSGPAGHVGSGHAAAGGHAGGAGHSGAGHGGASHAGGAGHGASGHAAGHSAGQQGSNALESQQAQPAQIQNATGPLHLPHEMHRFSVTELLLNALNPMRIAGFVAFFGITGRLALIALPFLGMFSMVPAVVGGAFGAWLMLKLMTMLGSAMTSSNLVVHNLVGHMGEITVPITEGRVGEMTCIVESKRYTYPARPAKSGVEFKKGSRVMIAEMRDGVSFVEPWTDTFIDPAYEKLSGH